MELREGVSLKPPAIVTCGRPGAERAALRWALAYNVPCMASDLPESASHLAEPLPDLYSSVCLSDATLLVTLKPDLPRELRELAALALYFGKPVLHLAATDVRGISLRIHTLFQRWHVAVLHITGSSHDAEPGIETFTLHLLDGLFFRLAESASLIASQITHVSLGRE